MPDPRARMHVDEALEAIAASAAENVPGADYASITVRLGDGTLETVASTSAVASDADALQYQTKQGPCYAAVTDREIVVIDDVAVDRTFPDYGPRAARLGIGSQIGLQFAHPDNRRAGLNLYAVQPNAFDRDSLQIAEMFGSQAAVLLGYARSADTLGEAVHTRQDIGTAVGIVMERYQIDQDTAFEYLVRLSQQGNVKLRDIARRLASGPAESSESLAPPD
jgi:GAF domain-containing protein